jgi:diguanylate cyclase (GGDEF)-like protein
MVYDTTAQAWKVSSVTPVYDDTGRHLLSLGNDILLTDFVARLLGDRMSGTYNMIVTEDGRLIAHPEKIKELQAASGNLRIDTLDDQVLKYQFQAVSDAVNNTSENTLIIDDENTETFLAATRIDGPGWWFVTVFPEELLEGPTAKVAGFIFFIGCVGLVIELILLYVILRKLVIRPLKKFVTVSEYVAEGNFDLKHIELPEERGDEVGLLAKTFHVMENKIHDYSVNMEQLVKERTEELNQARKHAEEQARTDQLTGLPNRRSFIEYSDIELSKVKRTKRNLTAIMMDIDKFKNVNDTYGHAIGDDVIRALAGLLKSDLRASDFSARMGGEEFVVLLSDTDASTGKKIAEELRQKIEKIEVPVLYEKIGFTSSFGVAQFSDEYSDIDDLLAAADKALYAAKEGGRNRVVVAQE